VEPVFYIRVPTEYVSVVATCHSHPAVFGFNLNNALNTELRVSSEPTEFLDSIVRGATTNTS